MSAEERGTSLRPRLTVKSKQTELEERSIWGGKGRVSSFFQR